MTWLGPPHYVNKPVTVALLLWHLPMEAISVMWKLNTFNQFNEYKVILQMTHAPKCDL